MPTYVYACDACGNQFEKFQSFKDEPLRNCPCGQEGNVRRVLQPVGIVFKGSGWHLTDYRKNGSASDTDGKSEAAGSTAASTADEKTTGKTDSKTDASKPAEAPASKTSSESATPTTT
jgi:putative FmdB family regulatory protein